jgi:hypothetical protein
MAELRAEIATLESEFEALREQVINGEVEPAGNEWIAEVYEFTTRRISVADAKRVLPADTLEALLRSKTASAVRLRPRKAQTGEAQ